MRVISFQSPTVLGILKNDGVYYAKDNLKREDNDYHLDREQLGGHQPCWVFTNTQEHLEEVYDARRWIFWRNEMSLGREESLDNFMMLELEIDHIKPGITHNGSKFVSITDCFRIEQLKAVYRMHSYRVFYNQVKRVETFCKDPLFVEEFDTGNPECANWCLAHGWDWDPEVSDLTEDMVQAWLKGRARKMNAF